jgi:hypothetical protein
MLVRGMDAVGTKVEVMLMRCFVRGVYTYLYPLRA